MKWGKRMRGSQRHPHTNATRETREPKKPFPTENKMGAGVHITGDRPLSRVGYWSIKTVMAVEPYIDVVVEPGKDFAWKYTYDYYTTGDSGDAK